MEELVSIIMPAYNCEKYVSAAIESVICQTYFNWELIVVDDCSIDDTFAVISSYSDDKRIKVFGNEKNRGVSYTRLVAVSKAKGDWIAFLDSDDVWEPDKLVKQFILQKEKNAELIYTGSAFMNDLGNKYKWIFEVPTEVSYKELLKQNVISNSSTLVKKDLYVKFAPDRDDIHEDFACWLGILKTGVIAYGVNEPLLIYRLTNSSKSSNKFKAVGMNWKTYRYNGLSVFKTIYYMCWYIVKGLLKYKNLK